MRVSGDPDEVVSGIDDDIRRVQDRAERMSELAVASDGVRGSAVSRGRDLVVEVDASGRVTKLQISNQALSRGGTRIASELMGLLGEAEQHAQGQLLQAAAGVLGDGDPLLETLRLETSEDEGAGVSELRGVEAPRLGVSRKSGGLW